MTDTLTSAQPAAPAAILPDPTVGVRRRIGAVALPLAFVCQLVCNALYAIASADGGSDTGTGDETLAFYAAHTDQLRIGGFVAMIGCLLVIPGVLAAMRLLRTSRPRLSLVAGALMIAGYVSYLGIVMSIFTTIPLATMGVDAGAALDASADEPFTTLFFALFVLGNLLGTLLLGLSVILSRALPRVAGLLIIGWPVGHIVNLVVGNEWFAVTGGALEIAGLAILAARALRTPDAEWAARG